MPVAGAAETGRAASIRAGLWAPVSTLAAIPILFLVWYGMASHPWHDDSYAFWNAWADGSLYPPSWQPVSEYVYSPAFAQAFWPLTTIRWTWVNGIWTAVQLGALVWMLGAAGAVLAICWPIPFLPGTGTPVFATLNNGNPQILLAAAITLGLTRWPGAFAFALLTKVSAGIGILAFAARGEWRRLGIAVGVTGAIAAVSVVVAPGLWVDWINLLAGAAVHAGSPEAMAKERFLPVPLAIRGVVGVVVVILAARTNRLWLVPVGCFLALPDIHLGGFAVLTAVPAVWLRTRAVARSEAVTA
jgi:hypothetical protein